MTFIDTLKQRAKKYLNEAKQRTQTRQEEQRAAMQTQPSFEYKPPQFIQSLQEKIRGIQIPQLVTERPEPKPLLTETTVQKSRPQEVKQETQPKIEPSFGQFLGDITKQFNLPQPQEFVKPRPPVIKREITPEEREKAERFKETLKDIAQSFPRKGAGAVMEVIEKAKGIPSGSLTITPGAGEVLPEKKYGKLGPKVERFLFGEKPVESLSKQGEETLKGFGVSESTAKQLGLTTGMVFLGLDLLPPGGKDVAKLLAKTTKKRLKVKKVDEPIKPVAKPEIKPEVKPEAKSEVKSEIKPIITSEGEIMIGNTKVGTIDIIRKTIGKKDFIVIDDLVIKPKYRNRKYGRQVIEQLKKEGKEIRGYAMPENIGFWKKMGAQIKVDEEGFGEFIIPPEIKKAKPEVKPKVEPEVKPAISKELEPLAEEARKYKSAEEFISSIGDVIYHQSDAIEGIPTFDAFFGTEKFVKTFPKEFGEKLTIAVLPKNAKILNLDLATKEGRRFMAEAAKLAYPNDVKFQQELLTNPITFGSATADDFYGDVWVDKNYIIETLKNPKFSKYDAVSFREEILVPKKTLPKLKTKQQLIDFYNQAVKAIKPETKPVVKPEVKPEPPKLKPTEAIKAVEPEKPTIAETVSPLSELPQITKKKPSFNFRERGFITRAKETSPELEMRIHGQYVPRSTDRLAIKAKNLIKDDIVLAEKIAREGTDDKAVAVASELIKHYNDLAEAALNEADKIKFYDRTADIVNELAPKLTEMGRSIQAASIYGRLTPEGMLRFTARQIQKYNEEIKKVSPLIRKLQRLPNELPQLTGQQVKELIEEARRIEAMPDGEAKMLAFHQFQDKVSALVPTPLMNKIITIWKAGLLTGLKTSGLNIMANLFHGVSEVIKDIPAAAVDSVASLFTGKRTMAFTLKGIGKGIEEGFEKGWQYLKTGFSERDIGAKLDYKRIHFGNSPVAKALQKYEETIFRIIGAEDQPFYYGAKARSLQNQAIVQAKNQGLRGEAARKFVDDLVANPTDEMLKNAVSDAEVAVFQQKTALGKIATSIQRMGGGGVRKIATSFQRKGGGVGEIIVPFARTPSAVAMQIINYSPIGLMGAIGKAIVAGRNFPQIQRQFSLAMGRGITGTAVLGLGAWLYNQGRISLGYPTDQREREQQELEGQIPNAIKIGNQWRQVQALGPLGLMLLWGGYLQKFYNETGSPSAAVDKFDAFLKSVGGIAKTFTEQTFVRGAESALGLLTEPERSWQAAVRTLSGPLGPSAIPTIVSDIARATDPYQRITSYGIKGIYPEGFMARIPGLRQQLQPRIDVAGQIVERPAGPIATMIDPTRPSLVKTSPAIAELARLSAAGYRVTPTDIGGKYGYKSLTPEQNTRLEQDAGQRLFRALDKLFASEKYQEMTDEEREKSIQDLTEKARINARARLLKEILQGLSGKELNAKIKELEQDKVLTQDVREKLIEIWEE